MRAWFLVALAVQLVSAIQMTEPAAGVTLNKGQTITVKWTSVVTDPTSFNIFVVNYITYPPVAYKLADNVQTSAGQATVTLPCDIRTDVGFQIRATNGDDFQSIYAQTGQFSITGSCSPTSTCTWTTTSVVTGPCTAQPTPP